MVSSYGELGLVWVSLLWAVGDNNLAIDDGVTIGDLGFCEKTVSVPGVIALPWVS